jgi:hypothetical protein
MRTVERVKDIVYKCQIALTLSVVSLDLQYYELPMRYNMPNHAIIAEHFAGEIRDLRIFHYLNSSAKDFIKDVDMETPASVGRWLARPLTGERIDLLLRKSFAGIHGDVLHSIMMAAGENSPERSTYAQQYESWHLAMKHRFVGYVDGVHGGEVSGWAVDRNHPEVPPVVTIAVNRCTPIQALACQYRADIAAAYRTPGLHGFKVRLPAAEPADADAEISVTCDDGRPLANGVFPLRAEGRQELPRAPGDAPCVLFMHIQKTAGTAFRDAIVANYSSAETALIYPNPPGFPFWYLLLMPEEQRRNLRCVIGHIAVGIHEKLSQPSEYVTILRDPVKRVISNYRHMCRMRTPPAVTPEGKVVPLETLLESGASVELDNLFTRCFSGSLDGTVNQEWYERALANLHRFRFIGHQEQSDASWTELCRLYGWSQGTLGRTNVGSETPMPVSERTLAAIAHYNQYDLMLYQTITSGGCAYAGVMRGTPGRG